MALSLSACAYLRVNIQQYSPFPLSRSKGVSIANQLAPPFHIKTANHGWVIGTRDRYYRLLSIDRIMSFKWPINILACNIALLEKLCCVNDMLLTRIEIVRQKWLIINRFPWALWRESKYTSRYSGWIEGTKVGRVSIYSPTGYLLSEATLYCKHVSGHLPASCCPNRINWSVLMTSHHYLTIWSQSILML